MKVIFVLVEKRRCESTVSKYGVLLKMKVFLCIKRSCESSLIDYYIAS